MNEKAEQPKTEKPANEHAGFYFTSFLKITDTKTNEVVIQVRGEK
jgi:hypothetical protein